MDGKDRYEGCLLSSANTSCSSEASPFPIGWGPLTSLLPAVWTFMCPHTFTKLMKPVLAFLKQRDIRLIIYLNDLIIFHNDWEMLTYQLTLIQELGLTINCKKSQIIPTQEIVFLGLMISTISMTASLPKEKLTKLKQEVKSLLLKSKVTLQRLATFVGMITVSKQTIRMSPLYHRQVQTLINRVVPLATSLEEVRQIHHQMVEISQEAKENLLGGRMKCRPLTVLPC